jgi:hypothetical protein
MKNTVIEQKQIKSRYKRHFMENERDYAAGLKAAVNFLVA